MKNITLVFAILAVSLLSACSSTGKKDYQVLEREYTKKPLISDLHLKVALLDRPIPEDQKMMLAFAKQRQQLQAQYPQLAYVSSVAIRGSKEEDSNTSYQDNGYLGLKVNEFVATDANAITVMGPK